MALLSTISKGVKAIFGKSTLDIATVFNTITTKMDDWKFTEEERARYNKEAADAMALFAKETLTESTERSASRREVARLVIYLYLLICVVGLVFLFINTDVVKLIIEFCNEMYLTAAFIAIIAFFFGGYYMDKFRKTK